MKAISPLISIILIIAFVVAVGGLLSVWLTTLTSSQTGTVQQSTEDITACSTTTLKIDEARFPAGSTSNVTQALVNVTVQSIGDQDLKNVTIVVISQGGTQTSIKFFNATGDDFEPGRPFTTSINVTGNVTLPPETVTVSGVCQSRYTISAECKAGDPCMKAM